MYGSRGDDGRGDGGRWEKEIEGERSEKAAEKPAAGFARVTEAVGTALPLLMRGHPKRG